MNCLNCGSKGCKTEYKDCPGTRAEVAASYKDQGRDELYKNADALVSHGRAGTLSRLEELAEFAAAQDYKKIGIAYCFGVESLARDVADFLKGRGFAVGSYRCTLNGLTEETVHPSLGKGVGCNPLGQARAIEEDGVDFVVEMGLCLGHDVLFHQALTRPFTVFLVKDRVWNHCPARALPSYTG